MAETLWHPFDQLMELDAADIRLDYAALHLARDAYPGFDLARCVAELDRLAAQVAAQRPGLAANLRYQAAREVLVDASDFRGNSGDYYDPANSYLNLVLERRRGIPVSLSVVWIEVCRRLKWPVRGIGFPGHFLIRFDDPERFVVVDPFNDGRSLSEEDCQKLLADNAEGAVKFGPKLLEPIGTRAILSRMLQNLRSLYFGYQNWERLESVLCRLLALEPANPQHLQDLAAVRARRGDLNGAFGYLEACLARNPQTVIKKDVTRDMAQLRAALAALN